MSLGFYMASHFIASSPCRRMWSLRDEDLDQMLVEDSLFRFDQEISWSPESWLLSVYREPIVSLPTKPASVSLLIFRFLLLIDTISVCFRLYLGFLRIRISHCAPTGPISLDLYTTTSLHLFGPPAR